MTDDLGTAALGETRGLMIGATTAWAERLRGVRVANLLWRLFPILFFESFLLFTVVVFFYGPWPYMLQDTRKLVSFLVAAHLGLLGGYLSKCFRRGAAGTSRVSATTLLRISIFLNLLFFFPTLQFRTASLIPALGSALSDPGHAYETSILVRGTGVPVVEYGRILAGPLLSFLLPLTGFFWADLSSRLRLAAAAAIGANVAIYIAMGTNKLIFDVIFTIPWLVVAAVVAGRLRPTFRQKVAVLVLAATALGASLAFFSRTQSTRYGNPAVYGYLPSAGVFADYTHPVFSLVPESWNTGVLSLSTYLSSGYYALDLALDEPFVPTFGAGNSFFLARQASRILDDPTFEERPYPMRIEKYGFDVTRDWCTIYPWLASDVSFPGVVLVVFLIGRYFAESWVEVVRIGNPFAVCMFAQFVIMLFYFAANNQCFQSGEGAVSFVATFVAWRISRRRGRWVRMSETRVPREVFTTGPRNASFQA